MTGVVDENEDSKETAPDIDSGIILPSKQVDDESSEKVDSGMDEEMAEPSPDAADLNSDSEDEPVVSRRKLKKPMVLDDDDDDTNDANSDNVNSKKECKKSESEEESEQNSVATDDTGKISKKKTITEALSAIMDSDSDNDAGQSQKSLRSTKDGTSSDDEIDSITTIIRKKKMKKSAVPTDDEGDSTPAASQSKNSLFNSDLFDAEESDSDKEATADVKTSNSDHENSDDDQNADDEGFGDDDIDPKLRAKLLKMKGAAKKPRKGQDRKAKPKLDSLMDIHSESQRLIRESRVALPYHQPTPKPLNDFLARATKKQQDYKALRAVRELKKPSVIQHVIANSSPSVMTPLPVQPKKRSPFDTDSSHLSGSETGTLHSQNDKTMELGSLSKKMDFEEDELPDLDNKITCTDKTRSVTDETVVNNAAVTDTTHKVEQENKTECAAQDVSMEVEAETPIHNSGDNTEGKCGIEETETTGSSPAVGNIPDNTEGDGQAESETVISESLEASESKESVSEDKETTDSAAVSECASVNKTPKILMLSEFKDVTPRLSGGPESLIDFDEESEAPLPTGRDKLFNRFLEHAKKKKHMHAKDVNISIVEKESIQGNSAELKLTSITYHVNEEDDNQLKKLDKPGAKLLALKEQLQSKMKVKREEARQKRQELYALENEEGFEEENEEEKILDDDAEMSDKSDTDIDDDQFDAEFGEEEFEEEEEDNEKPVNPFADAEASEDDEDFNPDEVLNKESDDDDDDDDLDSEEEGTTMKLKLDTTDDDAESDFENPSQNVRSSSKKKRKHVRKLAISDDEESNLPPAQATTEEMGKASFKISKDTESPKENLEDDDFLSPLSKHLAPTQTQKEKTSGLTLPIEDSQDLYGNTSEPCSGMTYPASVTQPSQGLNFIMEDSQSQMLDADGFFKVKSTTKKPSRQSLGLDDINSTQDNMNELMGLCSGRFLEQSQDDGKRTSCKQLFSDTGDLDVNSNTQGQVSDELLGLCSGFFPNDASQQPKSQGVKRKLEEDEDSNVSFTLLSDNENHMDSDKDELEDADIADQNDEVDGDASHDKVPSPKKFRGFRGKITGKMRKEFVDAEAELSGSEFDSDEDLDLDEEDDIMEMELGDQDITLTEEELRNQVGRAHLKETIDSDKREIMRLQEMYLPDGDLYSDGGGRMRRFRWKNMDDESQQDMFDKQSDEEAPEEDADELRWRMERFEREKFLQEEQEKEEKETQNSQFFNFGKKFALKIKDPVTKSSEKDQTKTQKNDKKENQPVPKPVLRSSSGRKGSFLTRSKEALAKIAERTKSTVNPNATRNSRNFVFQHVSPEKSDVAPQPKPVTRPKVSKMLSMQPPAKRQRTKTEESKPGKSIFNILER